MGELGNKGALCTKEEERGGERPNSAFPSFLPFVDQPPILEGAKLLSKCSVGLNRVSKKKKIINYTQYIFKTYLP